MPDERPRKATALSYEGKGAPRVVASGKALVAERILDVAREAGIPIRQDRALAEALAALELEQEIPADLYAAVAETLVWAYALDARARS